MPQPSNGPGLREHALMLRKFLRNPITIGAVAASSRALARRMVAHLPTDRPLSVVELGPGTGPFTAAIVGRVTPESRVLAIDLEPTFVEHVRSRWPSVDCVCASAVELERLVTERGMTPIDHIVSGLPFASLPLDMTRGILDAIDRTLRPGGTFTTFQYLHGYGLRPGRIFRGAMNDRMGRSPERRLVIWNLPPAFALTWRRPERP
jgi:phospholipid N-methyltransferase